MPHLQKPPIIRLLPWLLGLLLLAAAHSAPAAPTDAWLTSELGSLQTHLGFHTEFFGDQRLSNGAGELGYSQMGLRGATPLWQNSTQDLSITGRANYMSLDSDAALPSGKLLPSGLWDLNLALQYRRQLEGGSVLGLSLRGGAASDKPFNSENETQYGATAFARIPGGPDGHWLVLLNYDNNREIFQGFPLTPGGGYWYHPSARFQVLAGIPFSSLHLRPINDLDLNLSYVMVRTLRARATYHVNKPLSLYTGLEMLHHGYLLADRPHHENRLFFYQKRALAGMAFALGRGLVLDINGGWAFDQFFFQGENYGDRWQDRLSLEDGAFFGGQLGYHF